MNLEQIKIDSVVHKAQADCCQQPPRCLASQHCVYVTSCVLLG